MDKKRPELWVDDDDDADLKIVLSAKREAAERMVDVARDKIKAEIAAELERNLNWDRVVRSKEVTFKDLLDAS